jgi:hypothetical protein
MKRNESHCSRLRDRRQVCVAVPDRPSLLGISDYIRPLPMESAPYLSMMYVCSHLLIDGEQREGWVMWRGTSGLSGIEMKALRRPGACGLSPGVVRPPVIRLESTRERGGGRSQGRSDYLELRRSRGPPPNTGHAHLS